MKGIAYEEELVFAVVPCFLDLFHCKLGQKHLKVSGSQIQNTIVLIIFSIKQILFRDLAFGTKDESSHVLEARCSS